jgi:hypothetical protein
VRDLAHTDVVVTRGIPGRRGEVVSGSDPKLRARRLRRSKATPRARAVRLWAVVVAFAAVTVVRSFEVGIPMRDPHGSVLRNRVVLSLVLVVLLAVVDAAARSSSGKWTPARAWAVICRRWTRERVALALSGLSAYHLTYFCYHNLKSWDVLNEPRDLMLLGWDRWLFLGHSPAVLLHDLLGQHVATYVLMVVYESFSTLATVAVVAAIVFPDRIRDGYIALASGVWIWILGVGSYYLIPSLGPFHAAPGQFAELPHTMIQSTQSRYLAQRAHLLAHPHAADSFAQISAFASLHVGVTGTIWLLTRYFHLVKLSRALAVFLLATIVATVYLGWHFAVDDVAGLIIAAAAVCLGHLTMASSGLPGSRWRRVLRQADSAHDARRYERVTVTTRRLPRWQTLGRRTQQPGAAPTSDMTAR